MVTNEENYKLTNIIKTLATKNNTSPAVEGAM